MLCSYLEKNDSPTRENLKFRDEPNLLRRYDALSAMSQSPPQNVVRLVLER